MICPRESLIPKYFVFSTHSAEQTNGVDSCDKEYDCHRPETGHQDETEAVTGVIVFNRRRGRSF
jgi:hypothetical protein